MKLVWFKMLNAAASNLRLTRSVNLNVLASVKSVSNRPGPTKVFRPRLPMHPKQGVVNTGNPFWLYVPPPQGPFRTLPPGHQPVAQVLWLKPLKAARLLSGLEFDRPIPPA